ncbi:MAG: NAD-dependent epimerase/dehydratase family protein, partial [Lentilitoribacter sp.]
QSTNFVIPKIVEHFKNKRSEISLGNTKLYREFGDVRDVANIYAQIIAMPPIGEVVNVCSGRYHRLDDIIDICSELTAHRVKVNTNPDFLRPGEPEKIYGGGHKLTKYFPELQFRGIHATLSWMLNEL